jgi:cytochrome c peroxidase
MSPKCAWAALALVSGLAACADAPTGTSPQLSHAVRLIASDPAAETALGKLIFFDNNLSANGNQSCASCHDPAVGWTGPIAAINLAGAVYEGSIAGRFGNRKPPSSAYATQSPVFHQTQDEDHLFVGGNFWDGRATGERLGSPAAEQALGPFLNPVEQALATPSDVVTRICSGPYGADFMAVYGATACDAANVDEAYDAVGVAVAAFEGSAESNAFSSKYDAWLAGRAKLTPEEHLGLALFKGKGRCAACHVLENGRRGGALFTDFTFDNLGIPKNPANPWYTSPLNPQGADWVDLALGEYLESRSDHAVLAGENYGKHKVPTLRNVDLRPSADFVKAYGHNGYFKSLWATVHFYNTRDVKPACPGAYTEAQALAADCWPAPEVAANVNRSELGNLRLTRMQELAIVAFLKALSDGYQP